MSVEDPEPTWDQLAAAHERSEAWSVAAGWAASVLAAHLGEDWPRLAKGQALPLRAAATHTLAMFEGLELALLLDDSHGINGSADLRRELAADRTADRVAHATSQLELAALAVHLGWEPWLERRTASSPTPVDVSIKAPSGMLDFEVKVLFPSARTREWVSSGDRAADALWDAAAARGLGIEGEIPASPTDEHIDQALAWVDDSARLVALGAVAAPLRRHGMHLAIRPIDDPERGRLTVAAAGEDLLRRLIEAIGAKATALPNSPHGWVRVDALNGVFMMTRWGHQGLAQKLRALEPAVRSIAGDASVVVCSGVATHPGQPDETAVAEGNMGALRQVIPPLRAREVLVIPGEHDPGSSADVLELFAARPRWLDHALACRGLPTLNEILET